MSRKPRVAVDWDATVVEEKFPDTDGEWLPGAVRALQILHRHFELVIFTCRVAPVMQDEKTPHRDAEKQKEAIIRRLESIGLGDVEVWQRPYKPPAIAYIDDRGIAFDGNWSKIVRSLTARIA